MDGFAFVEDQPVGFPGDASRARTVSKSRDCRCKPSQCRPSRRLEIRPLRLLLPWKDRPSALSELSFRGLPGGHRVRRRRHRLRTRCPPGSPRKRKPRKRGWELRCYPSTVVKASVGRISRRRLGRHWLGLQRQSARLRNGARPLSRHHGKPNRGWSSTKAKPSTKSCTPGAPMASLPASG